jgi:hypothetical protein
VRLSPFLLLSMLTAGSAAAAGLTPHKVEYTVEISVLSGRLTTVVTAVGDGYMANSVIEPVGISRLVAHGAIQESSFFVTDEHGVRPEQYRSVDTLSTEDQNVSFDFDWRHDLVTGTVNDKPVRFELQGRVHDRVSIQYQLMLDLMNGRASDRYLMLDGDELKLLEVETIGRRRVKVPAGEFEAIGIQHHKQSSSRVTTLWCVEELGYLPVVIEQHKDGKLRVRARMTKYVPLEPRAQPATGQDTAR